MITKVEFTHDERFGRLHSIRVERGRSAWPERVKKEVFERWLMLYFGLEYDVPEIAGWSFMEKECSYLNYVTEIEFRHAEIDLS